MRLSLHFCPSRPTVRWRPANLTICESTYCRLSSTKLLFGLLAPSGRIRISARWYSFFTEVQNFSRFKLILVEIATTRLIQRRVISYRLLCKIRIYLTYILYQKFFEKSSLFHKPNFVMHRSKSFDVFMSHNTQQKIVSINFFYVDTRSVNRHGRTTFWMCQ